MIERLLKDWVVFVLVALVFGLFIWASISSHRELKKEQKQNKPQEKK